MANSKIGTKISSLKSMGKKIDPNSPLEEQKNVTLIEYISLLIARVGGMFGTTLTGTLAATFLYELYFGPVGVTSDEIANISAVQTTITTILGIAMPLIAGIIVQKWKSRWGRYRQWYIICLIPIFVLTVSFYWVPSGWTVRQMTWLRYGIAALQTVFNAFNNLGQNLTQVITPNYKEKKSVATLWQIAYYLGYGLAYLSPELYKLFSDNKSARYLTLTIIAASMTFIGNLMCGLFCKERIELAKKPKAKLSKSLFTLFKYRNYRAYQYFTWVNVLAGLGKWS
ncbi:MAG: MFS transporter, partial [Clostridia bacterium]|nr:MFS transporter [Clostridia bacterium]